MDVEILIKYLYEFLITLLNIYGSHLIYFTILACFEFQGHDNMYWLFAILPIINTQNEAYHSIHHFLKIT